MILILISDRREAARQGDAARVLVPTAGTSKIILISDFAFFGSVFKLGQKRFTLDSTSGASVQKMAPSLPKSAFMEVPLVSTKLRRYTGMCAGTKFYLSY